MIKKLTSFVMICTLFISSFNPVFASGALFVTTDGQLVTYDSNPVKYRCDKGNLGKLTNLEITAIVDELLNRWELISTAMINLQRDNPGLLNTDVNSTNYSPILDSQTELGYTPIVFDSDGSIVNDILGSGSSRKVLGFAGPAFVKTVGSITYISESVGLFNGVFINGTKTSSDPELDLEVMKGTILHEFGHAIGLDHSQINVDSLEFDSPQTVRDEVPLMFPISVNDLSDIKRDDKSSISLLYPNSTELAAFGEINGHVYRQDGTTPVLGANVIARNTSDTLREAVSCISGYIDHSGSFRLFALPPGNYRVEIEPINSSFVAGSSVGHYSENSSDLSFQNPVPHGYYKGPGKPIVTDINEALTISVLAGQVVKDIDIIGTISLSNSSSSSSTSSTGGPVGDIAQGCTCSYSTGIMCPACTPVCPSSHPHKRCLFGDTPNCCDKEIGGKCTSAVYCPVGTSSSTSGGSSTSGAIGDLAQGCACTNATGVKCTSCATVLCPPTHPYQRCIFGDTPGCCDRELGGLCIQQLYCPLGSSTSSTSTSGSTSSTSGQLGNLGTGCTCNNQTGISCSSCTGSTILCPSTHPFTRCIGGSLPGCCNKDIGGNCIQDVYCPLGASTSTTSSTSSGSSSTSTSGQVGSVGTSCTCNNQTGIKCSNCSTSTIVCPSTHPFTRCIGGSLPGCCNQSLGGSCIQDVYCPVGASTSTSSTSGGSTSGGTSSSNIPFCSSGLVICNSSTPTCLNGNTPICGSTFGFTGNLAGPGCTNSTMTFFDHGQAFCRSQFRVTDEQSGKNESASSCSKSKLCPEGRYYKSCREDRTLCDCICPFSFDLGKRMVPLCDKYDEIVCAGNKSPKCSNEKNIPDCTNGKLYCKDIDNEKIDLVDKIYCQ